MGKRLHKSEIFNLTEFSTSMLFIRLLESPFNTSDISSPTILNSLEPKPRVVAAGLPSRMPEVTDGFSGSNGTPFLLQVKPAFSKDASAISPVNPLGLRSTNNTCVSVPPQTMSNPFSIKTFDKTDAFLTTCST